MTKVFLYSKWTKWNTIICETSTKMETLKSNRLFCNVYPNLPKTSFTHKMSKNKAHSGNEHLKNIPEMEICKWNQLFCNFTQTNPKFSPILKWAKLKLAKQAKLKSIFKKRIL